jgi:hypothetical protein
MIKKIIGAVLMIVAVFGAIVLLTYGGAVFPHISGPIVLGAVGGFLFFAKRTA